MNGYSYEWIGKEGSGHWRLRDKRDNAIGFCYSEHNARTITDALNAEQDAEALALLRELNDALKIPGWLQPRVDAVFDRHEPLGASETPFLTAGGDPAEPMADHDRIAAICELDGCCMLRDKTGPQAEKT